MNKKAPPFLLTPWQQDFLPALLRTALKRDKASLEQAVFIFPHSRPARYMEQLIRHDERIGKPCLLPRMLTVSALFKEIQTESGNPSADVGILDQVGLLFRCVREEQQEQAKTGLRLPVEDAESFFPWGVHLSSLFEECFIHNHAPGTIPSMPDLPYLEDELPPLAAAILSRLSQLYSRYVAALKEKNWSTPGFTAMQAAQAILDGHKPGILSRKARQIYIAGFYSLSGAEDVLFKMLWKEYGAVVLIHADPDLIRGGGHWSCVELDAWMKNWGAGCVLQEDSEFFPEATPKINFYSGHDVHSQLAALQSVMKGSLSPERKPPVGDTAIILPDTTLLTPLLHHIDATDVNISMGYPLADTLMSRFLENLLLLHENSRSEGQYWQDCIRFLRQPYLKMLELPLPEDSVPASGQTSWRELLLRTEHTLRRGRRYVHLPELMHKTAAELTTGENLEKLQTLCEIFKLNFIDLWTKAHNLNALGQALDNVCALLLNKGGNTWWQSSPLDAECLYRFMRSVLPQLKGSTLSRETLPQSALFSIFRELLRTERIPFDAYPLTALQIMGLLESRLLNFKTLFILDVTDDLLPGARSYDPLLPDSLRPGLGLPGEFRRRCMSAYYFFRLLRGTENVYLFWQEGIEPKGAQEGKKLKSRFIEELIWKEEQSRDIRRILRPEASTAGAVSDRFSLPLLCDGPLFQIGSRIAPIFPKNRSIAVTSPILGRIREFLSAPVSATSLNAYLRCPAAFYYKEAAQLAPLEEVNEEDDPLLTGNIFHQTLRDFYRRRLGRRLKQQDLKLKELAALFVQTLNSNPQAGNMPADVRAMLKISGPRVLDDFLANHTPETTVQALEMPLSAPFTTTDGLNCRLTGKIDRLDQRPLDDGKNITLILDYKTGRISNIDPFFWDDSSIWTVLEDDAADFADTGFFRAVAEQMPDVQLPLYLYLSAFGQMERERGLTHDAFGRLPPADNAGWVALREKGKEIFLLPQDMPENKRADIIENKIELLLDYLLRRLLRCSGFIPSPGDNCAFCRFREICIVL